MNSPGFEVRRLTALNDFDTAIELAKTDPKINTDKVVIAHYVDQFDIEQKFNTISSLFNYVVKNFLVQNLPVSTDFKLKYYSKYHTLPEALNLAAFYNDQDFISNIKSVNSNTINVFRRLGGEYEPGKTIYFEIKIVTNALRFLDEKGLTEKVDCGNFEISYKMLYFFLLAKNWLWDKIYDEYSKLKPTDVENFKVQTVNGLLASRRKGILQNPPKKLEKIGITPEDFLDKIKLHIPFNLYTKRQIEFFADEIRKLDFETIEGNVWRRITNYSTLKALSDLYDKKFGHPMRKGYIWRQFHDIEPILHFTSKLSIGKEFKIAKYFGFTKQEYLTNLIQASDIPNYLFLHFVKEYLRRGFPKADIQSKIDKYYKEFSDDKFKIE